MADVPSAPPPTYQQAAVDPNKQGTAAPYPVAQPYGAPQPYGAAPQHPSYGYGYNTGANPDPPPQPNYGQPAPQTYTTVADGRHCPKSFSIYTNIVCVVLTYQLTFHGISLIVLYVYYIVIFN